MMRVANVPVRVIAAQFGIGKDTVNRHFHSHVSEKRRHELMVGPAQIEQLAVAAAEESKTVMEYTAIARSILFRAFVDAAEANDRRQLVSLADSLLQALRDYGKLTGELRQMAGINITQNVVNFTASPEFVQLSQGLLEIARAHPEVKQAIVGLLRRLDEPQSAAGGLLAPSAMGDAPRGAGTGVLGLPVARGGVIECAAVEVSP
jgi:AcrR family transcriptional regulator